MFIENIRLSKQARSQLITLKRNTGIKNWNTLCRWGFCTSLGDTAIPPEVPIPSDSNVEMTWRVFAGDLSTILIVLLKERCKTDGLGIDDATLAQQFRLHLHRGIAQLAGERDIRSIADLLVFALSKYRDHDSSCYS